MRSILLLLTFIFSLTAPGLAADPVASPSQLVDPFISTGGNRYVCGNNPPAATVPFGMVRLCPDTISASGATATNMSGYYYEDSHIIGFSHTRLCGTGAIDGGCFRVIPAFAATPLNELRNSRLEFTHDRESASPGYYSVVLPSLQVTAELTATTRVGLHRYTFESDASPQIVIDIGSVLGNGRSSECEVQIDKDRREITGTVRTFGSFSSRYDGLKVYFAAHFLRPWQTCSTWSDETIEASGTGASGDDVGVALTFAPDEKQQHIELAIALSHVSTANARENLKTELANRTFDDVQDAATAQWNDLLRTAQVEGGTQDDQIIFYTALYHSMMMPTTFTDVNGQYLGFDKQIHQADGFTYYTDMSLWDTFRTTHPLYTLLMPDRHRDMLRSLVLMAKQGGSLPRWPSGGGYTNSMFGAPAEIAIAEAWLKGIHNFDIETAYRVMRRSAMESAPEGANCSGRRAIAEYVKYGYCPSDTMSEAVAKTLEYASTDSAIGRLAAALGYEDDAELFSQRGQNYRHLWNPETQYFQPKDTAGRFSTPFKPTLLTYFDLSRKYTDDYVEGSALQWRWAVSHDAAGLVSLFSSKKHFVSELETFFENAPQQVAGLPNGYYWHGNQPDIHAAYLFNAAGRPDLTRKWVRWILRNKYGIGANGIDGNDDGGTLSAWHVLSSFGFYPIVGTDRYELSSPLWKNATLQIGDRTMKIVADHYAEDRLNVERIELNGKTLDRTWISHAELANGGTLRFVMID